MVVAARRHAIEPEIAALMAELKHRLERRFDDRFVALYLFGSRARGDHDPDSDVDVAVILDQKMPRSYPAKSQLLDDTYELMLETGLLHPALGGGKGCASKA
jgi:predicted nucleotidyltransferase